MRRVRQALPRARVIANLRTRSDDTVDARKGRKRLETDLTDLAYRAYKRRFGAAHPLPIPVMLASSRARRAAEFYVSEKAFEVRLPRLRKRLKAVNGLPTDNPTEAARRFCELTEARSDAVPPFAQMRAMFCYEDPNCDGLSDDPESFKRYCEREKEWEASFSPAVILNSDVADRLVEVAVRHWLNLAADLYTMLGRGRSPITAEIGFVAALARYWRIELQAVLGNSRAESSEQLGLFADYVRLSAKFIPSLYQPSHGWEHAIRRVLEPR